MKQNQIVPFREESLLFDSKDLMYKIIILSTALLDKGSDKIFHENKHCVHVSRIDYYYYLLFGFFFCMAKHLYNIVQLQKIFLYLFEKVWSLNVTYFFGRYRE